MASCHRMCDTILKAQSMSFLFFQFLVSLFVFENVFHQYVCCWLLQEVCQEQKIYRQQRNSCCIFVCVETTTCHLNTNRGICIIFHAVSMYLNIAVYKGLLFTFDVAKRCGQFNCFLNQQVLKNDVL